MEILAFTHVSVNYEDPKTASELREFDVNIPKAFTSGVAGSAIALSMVISAPDAQAAVRLGDKCAGVYKVQNELAFNGFLAESGKDSSFGPQTQAAVIRFQRAHGLVADGIVGASTAAKLGIAVPSCGGSTDVPVPSQPKVSTPSGRGLNVRATPSPSGMLLRVLANGTPVTLKSDRKSAGGYIWAELSTGGWVAVQYIK